MASMLITAFLRQNDHAGMGLWWAWERGHCGLWEWECGGTLAQIGEVVEWQVDSGMVCGTPNQLLITSFLRST